jgi:hypothetical protein
MSGHRAAGFDLRRVFATRRTSDRPGDVRVWQHLLSIMQHLPGRTGQHDRLRAVAGVTQAFTEAVFVVSMDAGHCCWTAGKWPLVI